MKCPRCGATMKLEEVLPFEDGNIKIYYCPKCGETANKGSKK